MNPALCIVAAGRGSRMGSLTDSVNKALLPIDGKAIIGHIIDAFPAKCDLVVAVGYKGDMVEEYVRAAYPGRNATFVQVENWFGPGSGPGHSQNCCREHLRRPFYFCTADCLVRNQVHDLSHNWVGVCPIDHDLRSSFSTVQVVNGGFMGGFKNKVTDGHEFAYIGMCGVRDWEQFWADFDAYLATAPAGECEHVGVFPGSITWNCRQMDWIDTGTDINYHFAKRLLSKKQEYELEKASREITYRLPGRLVKLGDPKSVTQRIERAKLLSPHVPPVTFSGHHLYAYDWVEGDLLYARDSFDLNCKLIHWCHETFWSKPEPAPTGFREACNVFYREKTLGRLARYAADHPGSDREVVVNGVKCRPLVDQFKLVDWGGLTDGVPVRFHGDLNPGNVIVRPDGTFCLIDWRDAFGNGLAVGDLYYDLGKLYAGLEVNWWLLSHDKYVVERKADMVIVRHEVTPDQRNSLRYFEQWLSDTGYDLRKVKTVAALVLLNMSPLHGGRLGEFLFHYGRYMLWRLENTGPIN